VDLPVSYADVHAAAARIAPHVHRTPVQTSASVDGRTGAKVFLKCENFQRAGAFKSRGAFNALLQLDDAQRRRGVLAYSSGNHAQAVALAARDLGVHAVIVMPTDAPEVKFAATRGYGAEVITYDRTSVEREVLAASIARERGLAVIPPFDHAHIVAGQGTAAKELFDEVGTLDWLFVPCGGGGLISGSALAAEALSPGCRVVGVEPAAGDDATRSFRTRTLQTCHNPETIADGARTHSLGVVTFPIVMAKVHDMVTVDDAELLRAMFYLWERMKIVVEPTGALGAAGLFGRHRALAGSRIGVLISGGNADVKALSRLA
jgi:threonine dehydratase